MNDFIVTNNQLTKNMMKERAGYELVFLKTVQEIIDYCQQLFVKGGFTLAADPMGGRRARPFPYLTVILSKTDQGASQKDWERMVQYSLLDSKRKRQYETYDEALKEDYRVLDCALTKAALKL